MKRPQFSLRLLLLITALVAVILGWQVAIRDYGRATDGIKKNEHQDFAEQQAVHQGRWMQREMEKARLDAVNNPTFLKK